MPTRLILLIALAGGLAIYFAVRPTPNTAPNIIVTAGAEEQRAIWLRPLEGEEPPDPCEFDVTVEVDTSEGKNRLYFNITEINGYYAESFDLRFWYSGQGKYPDRADSPLDRGYSFDLYVPANDVLRICFELVNAELAHVGGDIGTTGDWSATIDDYKRARVANPSKFPVVEESTTCN